MILISSCLIGDNVRYDGGNQLNVRLKKLIDSGKAIHACPELLGGLLIPREPAEIIGGDGFDVWNDAAKVVTISNKDVTDDYKHGAIVTLKILKKYQCDTVILKVNSPSCGSQEIYDGNFTGNKKKGVGVATALLINEGIKVYDENTFFDQNMIETIVHEK
ncbi:TPA: DUF523 domain-containing protein [Staphylococcus aureus]|nr:DUF523 domain-containing protein [Staphylococcus aureus]ELL5567051.1 DUF523 domain-containing protein [Staphylococcus aureus]NFW65266.1 DUF523 domain-containing protein [Staphylococcus aureus]